MGEHIQGNVDRFDDLTAHIQNVERAVRSIEQVHRPEPVVRRPDEFGFLVDPLSAESRPVGLEPHPVDQVVLGITDEDVAVERFRVRSPSV